MCIFINRISRNIGLDGRLHLQTSALLSQWDIPPRTTFLDSYDQTPPFHSLTRTPTTLFTCSQTIRCPWIGPPTQHICRYILLGLPHLQILFYSNKKKKVFLFYIYNFYFENLIYKWIKAFWKLTEEWPYFLGNVLVRVKVVFLPDFPLILSLLKHRGVETFFNKKNEDPK